MSCESIPKHSTSAVEECLTFRFPDASKLHFQNLQADDYNNVKPWHDMFLLKLHFIEFLITITIAIDKIVNNPEILLIMNNIFQNIQFWAALNFS